MHQFKNALNINDLHDLGFIGNKFTWRRGQNEQSGIFEKFDRAYCSSTRMDLFPNACVWHLPFLSSDHCLILLDLMPLISHQNFLKQLGSNVGGWPRKISRLLCNIFGMFWWDELEVRFKITPCRAFLWPLKNGLLPRD